MVQNRAVLAMYQLPIVRPEPGNPDSEEDFDILMVVNFFSPWWACTTTLSLSNYATINVKDELLRICGVSDITYLGSRDYSIRAWLDPQKLETLSMTANDVANAVLSQNLDAPAGQGQAAAGPALAIRATADRYAGPIDDAGTICRHHQRLLRASSRYGRALLPCPYRLHRAATGSHHSRHQSSLSHLGVRRRQAA